MDSPIFTWVTNIREFYNERKQYIKGETIFIPKLGIFIFLTIVTFFPLSVVIYFTIIGKVKETTFLVSFICYSFLTLFTVATEFFWALSSVLCHIVIENDFIRDRSFLVKRKEIKILEIKECRIRPVKAYNISSALVIGDMNGNEIWINPHAYHRKDLKTLVTKLGYPDAIKYKEETKKQVKARKRKQRKETTRWALEILIAGSTCLLVGAIAMFVLVRVLKIDYFNEWLGHVLGLSAIVGGYNFSSVVKKHTKKTKLSVLTLCALVLVALIVGMVFLFKRI